MDCFLMFKSSRPFIIILLYVATIMRKNSPNILNDLLTSPNSQGGTKLLPLPHVPLLLQVFLIKLRLLPPQKNKPFWDIFIS